ncbi:peroxidase TAP [Ephemerocybe angulata]|uniref:Peroxidase TAP n=1 Tax=Ephemerocybe angulata TaxID=980116 RepID=A0A8H6HJK8_9AGAR|nr:peroxidase TAP [Tulosesus angulatus]
MSDQQPLPPTPAPALDLKNIQGDILSGLPKKTETFYFFEITDVTGFRTNLRDFVPVVKTVAQTLKDREAIDKHKKESGHGGHKPPTIPLVGVNIAFSHLGFAKLGIDDTKLVDTAFLSGQRQDARTLGDKGTLDGDKFVPDWDAPFKQDIHGVFVVAGDSHVTVDRKVQLIEQRFKVGTPTASISKIVSIVGDVRPGDQDGHEHFGYLDGVSNPAIIGFDTNPPPGPAPVRPGVLLLGQDGDENKDGRDPWMADGSFLVFRQLFQNVPEFDEFVNTNRLQLPGLSPKEGADLFGARLVGRWKSGAPIDLTPFFDDPELADDPLRNNNFHFTAERDFQKLCPFAAHIRKTLPRADLEDLGFSIENRRIARRGIQFGPELTRAEKQQKKTLLGRGLLFVSYQSSIVNGFQFIQQSKQHRIPVTERQR